MTGSDCATLWLGGSMLVGGATLDWLAESLDWLADCLSVLFLGGDLGFLSISEMRFSI